MQHQIVVDAPIGKLKITIIDQVITSINFADSNESTVKPIDKFAQQVTRELTDYFANSRKKFTVPLQASGTDFQKKVWRALQAIPVGKTLTYGELAKQLKSSPRAVGNACRRNPTPVIVPCHRVVAQSGIGGFAGAIDGKLLAIKQWLLNHEGAL